MTSPHGFSRTRTWIAGSLAILAIGAAAPAQAAGWSAQRAALAVGDVAAFRPVSFATTLIGGVLFAVASPVLVPLDQWREPFDGLVLTPMWQTFGRPLGLLPAEGTEGHPRHSSNLDGCNWNGCYPGD